mgnify:CR=1 FL=1
MGAPCRILFITGTPGTGKSTVARKVAELLGARVLDVGALAVERGLVRRYIESLGAYEVDVERVREAVRRECERGGLLVVEGHVADAIPPELVEVAIVLRLDPVELERRLRERRYPEEKVLANVQCEILDTCLVESISNFGEEKVFEIDSTGKSVEEIAEEILEIFERREGPRPGSVDWMSSLERRGLLDKYLR